MNTILWELFNGRIYPFENIVPKDPKYRKIHQDISDLKRHFQDTLSDQEYECFEKLDSLYLDSDNIYDFECFSHGFRLGVALMMETLTDMDDLSSNL